MTSALRGLFLTAATTGLASVALLGRTAGGEDFFSTHVDDAHKTTREEEKNNRVFSGRKSPILPRRVLSTSEMTPAAGAGARGSAPDTTVEMGEDHMRESSAQENHHRRHIEVSPRRLGNLDDSEYHMMNDNDDDDVDNDEEDKLDVDITIATAATAAAAATADTTYKSLAAGGGEEEKTPMHRVPLQNMDNVQYFGQVMIGEPPQLMKILFDTGSSDTWVPGIGCNNCGLHSAFDDVASSTAVSMGRNFTNRYDSGSVEGSVIEDGVVIAGMAVKGVEMGLVRRQEHHIRGFKADGIMGLAFPSISTTRNTSPSRHSTLVQLLQEQFGPVGDIFSVYLTPSPNQHGSVAIFGGYDLDLVRRSSNRRSPSKRRLSDGNDKTTPPPDSPDSTAGYRAAASRRESHAGLRGRGGRRQQQQQRGHSPEGGGNVGGVGEFAMPAGNRGNLGEGKGNGVVEPVGVPARGRVGKGDEEENEEVEEEEGGRGGRREGEGGEGGAGEDKEGERGPGVLRYKQRQQQEVEEEQQQQQQLQQSDDDEPVIVWTPVVEYRGSLSYWTIQMTGWRTETAAAAVGVAERDSEQDERTDAQRAKVGQEMCPKGCQAIVDTGSSLLVPPRSKFRAVLREITGGRTDCEERHGMVSCTRCTPSEFPDIVISVVVSERPLGMVPLKGKYGWSSGGGGDVDGVDVSSVGVGGVGVGSIGVGGVSGGGVGGGGGGGGGRGRTGVFSQEFRLKPTDYLSQSWDGCEILVGEGRATDIWTLGDAFIKTYMTIFDVANLRVGFVCADGGRCLGGAAPPWRDASRLCLPFFGGGGGGDGSGSGSNGGVDGGVDDEFGAYCMYLHHDTLACALIASSIVLFVAGCVLWVWESTSPDPGSEGRRGGSGGGGGSSVGGSATTGTVTVAPAADSLTPFPSSGHSALSMAAPHPVLSGGEKGQQREHYSLKGSLRETLAEDGPTTAAAAATTAAAAIAAIVGRGGNGERRPQACLTGTGGVDSADKRGSTDRRHATTDRKLFLGDADDEKIKHRGEHQRRVFSGWRQGSKSLLATFSRGARRLSTAATADAQQRSSPPTRAPSMSPSAKRSAEGAGAPRRFWADDGRAVVTATVRQGDGMRSRGGTPRTTAAATAAAAASAAAAAGSPLHKCAGVGVGSDCLSSSGRGLARPAMGEH